MWDKFKVQSINSKKYTLPALFFGLSMLVSSGAFALTANDVLNKMDKKERQGYVAGVIGGFAYSRYLRDKPDRSGMDCINSWFYSSGQKKWDQIDTWFLRHPEKPAEALLYILLKRKCGA